MFGTIARCCIYDNGAVRHPPHRRHGHGMSRRDTTGIRDPCFPAQSAVAVAWANLPIREIANT